MSEKFKVLFLGDVVGRPGREIAKSYIERVKGCYDLVIVNVENASHGFGLTQKNHDDFINAGVDFMTSGNHIWDKKDIYNYIENSLALIRPLNYPKSVKWGVGYRIYNEKIVVVNLLGRTFMQSVDSPFEVLKELVENLGKDKLYIIDFHAEATAEKVCFGKYAAELGVCAVLGTHTHVQTADEKIIDNKCAYITDVGFTGAYESVIGMEYEGSLKCMTTLMPERFEVPEHVKKFQINGVGIEFCLDSLCADKIERINLTEEKNEN